MSKNRPNYYAKVFPIILFLSCLHCTTPAKARLSPYHNLANYLHKTIENDGDAVSSSSQDIVEHLKTLTKAQSTLKNIDGASHEFYQRSHNKNVNDAITGRAERTAGRIGACADALFGCELLDYAFYSSQDHLKEENDEEGMNGRQIIFNTTIYDPIQMEIVVVYEPNYNGGAGIGHGGINGLMLEATSGENEGNEEESERGRYFIIVKDTQDEDLERSLEILDEKPTFVELSLGLVSGEVVCLNSILWKAASKVINVLEKEGVFNHTQSDANADTDADTDAEGNGDKQEKNANVQGKDSSTIQSEKSINSLPAIHFVGRSLAGGVASLAALMLDGSIPMPKARKGKKRRRSKNQKRTISSNDESSNTTSQHVTGTDKSTTLHGFGKLRTSAIVLGAPPSISANIKASYITSIMYGDDIICRTTKQSLDRLRQRICRVQKGNIITKQMGWMTDTLSLTVSSLKTHAHGSEGEEGRLSSPGKTYLVRPRRMNGVSSIHEIGNRGGREALRAAVLWQLNDVLLSNSLWKHHSLKAYISGLNRVQLREVTDDDDDDDDEDAPGSM